MKRLIILTISFFLFTLTGFAQSTNADTTSYTSALMRFSGNIHQFNGLFPQEKVYLEFDNTAYFQGETIWFKAFVTHASTLKRAPSKVLYVDLLAPTGHLLSQLKLKIVAGQCDGAFPLVDVATSQAREKRGITEYPSGFYEVRAYTLNMLDFSKETVFSRVIPVYTKPRHMGQFDESQVIVEEENPLVEIIRAESKEPDKKVNVSFFPEGGDLIDGLPCRVAFKATGSNGLAMEGGLLLRNGQTDTIYTLHDGMGSFTITPHGTESARFITPDGKTTRFSLPKAVKSGWSMITEPLSDSLFSVTVRRTPDMVGASVGLAVTCRGELIHFQELRNSDSISFNLNCSGWPVGVCRITLYDTQGKILSSRSIFHNNEKFRSPTVTLATDSMSRQPFSKEILSFKLTDAAGNPIRDRFCISVRDISDYGNGSTDNLKTNLLLSSDLRGFIHDPAWYLEENDSIHREALNLLTLVQGWERYEWKYMTGQTFFSEKHRIEDSLTMNGWVLSYSKRDPQDNVDVFASVVPQNDRTRLETFKYHTDTTGYFGFNLSDFYGQARMTINLMSQKRNGKMKYEKSTRIKFERSDSPKPRSFLNGELDLSSGNHKKYDPTATKKEDDGLPTVIREDLGIILDDVDIDEKRQFVDYDTFRSWDAAKEAEMELDMGEYTTDVFGYFLEKGIRFETFEPFYYVHNQEKVLDKKPFDIPASIDMIDVKSIIVYDDAMFPNYFVQFTPLLVEYHRKHLDTDWFWWVDTCWTRYRLVDIQIKSDRELLSYDDIRNLSRRTTSIAGFSQPVEFYAPQYPEGGVLGDIDPRRTLYWNPNVLTDQDGNARVEFYNNSYTQKYTISGAGITASGTPYIINQNW